MASEGTAADGFFSGMYLGEGTAAIHRRIRAVSLFVERDRPLQDHIVAVAELVGTGALLEGL